ncbi:MAG: ectonucleotide pyrophosphatase/phosphodiesterase [Tannerellaceae bacterium]|nr:ectonucleotide pyrophosphatase/phosphodiesterase [Tannerellaceae bacterium]
MNKILSLQIIAAVVLSLTFVACSSTEDRYVVVLSMDGFRTEYLSRANTPVLDSLSKVGVKAAFRPCFPSLTFPNHYAMATGLHPDHHGLISNFFYAEDLKRTYRLGDNEAVTNPDFYGGEPIWNTAEKQGVRSASFFWVGSEACIQGLQPSICKVYDKSVPYMNRADSVVAWLNLPKDIRPHLIMWYMEEPDATGHSDTPDSASVVKVIEGLDRVLAHFFEEARKLEHFDKIDFIIVSDHGMATYLPENYVNLNDYLPRDSFEYIFDGVPALLYPKTKTYTEQALSILQNVPRVKVYRKENLPERYVYGKNPRIGDIVVVPAVGTYVQFREESRPRLGGTHGYDNFVPEMEAIFYAAGPSFKRGVELPVMANVNLYLIVSKILKLIPAPNDGEEEIVQNLLKKER